MGKGRKNRTYYSSSISFGKRTVQSSSRRQIGRPRRSDIDLSATDFEVKVIDCIRNRISATEMGTENTYHQKAARMPSVGLAIRLDRDPHMTLPHACAVLPRYVLPPQKLHAVLRLSPYKSDSSSR